MKHLATVLLLTVCFPLLAEDELPTIEFRGTDPDSYRAIDSLSVRDLQRRKRRYESWVSSLPTHTYTSKDGKSTYYGKFLYLERGKVIIRNPSNEETYLVMTELSSEDQKFVRDTIRKRKGLEVKKTIPKTQPKTDVKDSAKNTPPKKD